MFTDEKNLFFAAVILVLLIAASVYIMPPGIRTTAEGKQPTYI